MYINAGMLPGKSDPRTAKKIAQINNTIVMISLFISYCNNANIQI